jgi:hypothetical protein
MIKGNPESGEMLRCGDKQKKQFPPFVIISGVGMTARCLLSAYFLDEIQDFPD